MPGPNVPSNATEILRYARIYKPKLIDLQARIAKLPEQAHLVTAKDASKSAEANIEWARGYRQGKEYVRTIAELGLRLLDNLNIEHLPVDRLPCKDCIEDAALFKENFEQQREEINRAIVATTLSLYSSVITGQKSDAYEQARTLQFLELLPTLAQTTQKQPYAPFFLGREVTSRQHPPEDDGGAIQTPACQNPETKQVGKSEILFSWDLSNEFMAWKRKALEQQIIEVRQKKFSYKVPKALEKELEAARSLDDVLSSPQQKFSVEQKAAEPESEDLDSAEPPKQENEALKEINARISKDRRTKLKKFISDKKNQLDKFHDEIRNIDELTVVQLHRAMERNDEFGQYLEDKYGDDSRSKLPPSPSSPEEAASHIGWMSSSSPGHLANESGRRVGCDYEINNPCTEELLEEGHPKLGKDDVRPLGMAKLITVEERWLRYLPGEISSIETILAGELRKKETKRTQYFEEYSEQLTQQTEDSETTTESSLKQTLASQIQSELSTRFDSDLSVSASGSGGGTIGVVDFSGGASAGANLGVGMDTSLSTTDNSEFSQEIVSKAIERTKQMTQEIRQSRSYRKFETSDFHKIDNTEADAENNNAIYCYLDKEICLTERVYGLREFLNAEIMRPGRAIIEKEFQRNALNMSDLDLPPAFDIDPDDITPNNYMSLVGTYRASNVSPPPAEIKLISRTYKTDSTNQTAEPNESMVEKITSALTPFFGEYQRFVIQDNIEVPEGYEVKDVVVTVTHGKNGVSIPAHLPFSITGASIYALPTLACGIIPPTMFYYLPIAVWQVLMTASPLLHYNADSSQVTVNIGHNTKESRYFFFDPEELLDEIVSALSSAGVVNESFIDFLRDQLEIMSEAFLSDDDASIIAAMSGLSVEAIEKLNSLRFKVKTWLTDFVSNFPAAAVAAIAGDPSGLTAPDWEPIEALDDDTLDAIKELPAAVFKPIADFLGAVFDHVEDLLGGAFTDLLQYMMSGTENFKNLHFIDLKEPLETLPVSLNCVALKPGITCNLTVKLVRIESQALAEWRLETFERLSQAYYQLEADFETRSQDLRDARVHRDSPGIMRQEEHEIIKFRIMMNLHRKYSNSANGKMTLDEVQLFEHAIDWKNISYRLHNYGPRGQQLAMKKLGMYDHADERRKLFMDAVWAQVLLPLREDHRLEQVFLNYLNTGEVDFEADLISQIEADDNVVDALDELTVLYRDLVLQREQLPEVDPVHRRETLPTELIVIYEPQDGEPYPVNPIDCPEPDVTAIDDN